MEIALPFYGFSPCLDILPYDSTRMTHERKKTNGRMKKWKRKSPEFFFPAYSFVCKKKKKKKDYFLFICASSSTTHALLYFPSNVEKKKLFFCMISHKIFCLHAVDCQI